MLTGIEYYIASITLKAYIALRVVWSGCQTDKMSNVTLHHEPWAVCSAYKLCYT